MAKIGRNDPCSCGSGKKYKKCCLKKQQKRQSISSAILKGYEKMERAETEEACRAWWPAWNDIKSALTPEFRDTEKAQAVFPLSDMSIHDWLQDLSQELHNSGVGDPSFAARGIEFCRAVLKQFPDESDLFRMNFGNDLAELLFLHGQEEESERQFNALIEQYPDKTEPYVRLSSTFETRWQNKRNPEDLMHAIELLERAINYPTVDADIFGLENRLKAMRNEESTQKE